MSTHSPHGPVATAIAKQFGMYDPEHHPQSTKRTIDEILAILRDVPVAPPESLEPVHVLGEFRCCRCGRRGTRPSGEFEYSVNTGLRQKNIRPLCGPCVTALENEN